MSGLFFKIIRFFCTYHIYMIAPLYHDIISHQSRFVNLFFENTCAHKEQDGSKMRKVAQIWELSPYGTQSPFKKIPFFGYFCLFLNNKRCIGYNLVVCKVISFKNDAILIDMHNAPKLRLCQRRNVHKRCILLSPILKHAVAVLV